MTDGGDAMSQDLALGLLLVLLLALSFLFSGMEAGVFALNRLRVRQLARAGNVRARTLMGFLARPEDFLWTILVGNTLSMVAFVSLLVAGLHSALEGHPVVFGAAVAVCLLVYYAFGDLLPKMMFRRQPTRTCMAVSGFFRLIDLFLRPLVRAVAWAVDGVDRWTGRREFTGRLFANREEMLRMMRASGAGLTSDEHAMIGRVLALQKLTVAQVATPMDKVSGVEATAPLSVAIELCRERDLTRLPVWSVDGKTRRVAGVVSLKGFLYREGVAQGRPVSECMRPALFVHGDLRLEAALQRMQRTGERMAVVLGRDQREVGVVTLQDILRSMFGEVNL